MPAGPTAPAYHYVNRFLLQHALVCQVLDLPGDQHPLDSAKIIGTAFSGRRLERFNNEPEFAVAERAMQTSVEVADQRIGIAEPRLLECEPYYRPRRLTHFCRP